ncbi:helix-hairpin-helix domain-containing protein [Micromonospora sp. H33]|uniref:helix-hairpin-helix domain-containing protein n=1 Tax=Micromonospora sp. H33 TaxID=3452215 RepID=UPI003F8A821F
MAWSDWLIVVVALAVGVAAGWAILRRRGSAPATPTVDGEPATATTAVVHEPAPAATTDTAGPDATVDAATTAVADSTRDVATDGRADDEPAPAPVATAAADPVDHADMALTGDPVPAPDHAAPATDDTPPILPVAADEADVAVVAPRPAPAAEVDAEPARPEAGEPAAVAVEAGAEPEAAPEPAEVAPELAAVPAARGPVATPPVRPKAAAEAADDFRRIQGIGPKMAAALNAAGIRTYQQLAELDEAALRETIRAAGLRAAPSLATWPQQARVLAGAPEAAKVLPTGDGEDA